MPTRTPALSALIGLVIVALVASSAAAVVQLRRTTVERERAQQLAADVARLEAEVADLRDRLASGSGGGGGPLDGLLGGDLGDLGGLLDGLLDGDLGGLLGGDLGGLLGGGIPGVRCLTPTSDPGGTGGLGGLFDGLLDGLLGGRSTTPTEPDALVDHLSTQVVELRSLDFATSVTVDFLDDDALSKELTELFDDELDRDRLAYEAAVLKALRAIPADADLEGLSRELLDGQVAGFYEPETGRLVVRVADEGLRPIDRVTIVHELGHALVDQAIGLPALDEDVDYDATLARLAVVEGDATLLMNHWTVQHLSLMDQLGAVSGSDLEEAQAQLDAFPHHLQRELMFPYTDGLDLVCDVWLTGGWAAVDALYDDLPTTSAGVLFPARAGEAPAAPPALVAPTGGEELLVDTFGAAPLSWLFEAPGGEVARALDRPVERAAAWAGGEVRLWNVGGRAVVGLALRDRSAGDPPLCASVTDWYAAAAPPAASRSTTGDATTFTHGDGSGVVVTCTGDEVRVGFAYDVAVAARVAG